MPSWRASISKVMAVHPQLRHLVVGESSHLYSSNSVSTREYTWATFLPLSIIFQFRRLSNCYFLLAAVLANLPDVGSLNPFASVAPLIFVLIVSVGREFIEEYQAYLRDREINRTLALVVHRDGHLVRRQWSDIHPGDIVIVKEREHFPADLVLLLSSHAENAKTGSVAYMETSNLDGETNLKTREAPKLVGTVLATNPSAVGRRPGSVQLDIGGPSSEDGQASPKVVVEEIADTPLIEDSTSLMNAEIVKLSALVGSFFIDCEAPSTDMMKFQGTIATVSDHTRSSDNTEAVSIDNILLRGCSLRNTPWAAGVVVYAGSETKAIMNSRAHSMGQRKQSTVDKAMNKYVLVLFILQALLCGLATIFTSTYPQAGEEDGDTDPPWYLEGLSYQSEVVTYISYFLLLNTLIPVSLWVSVDVIKFAQSYLIEWDLQLHDEKRDLHARCNAKNMHEELGMVTHVFSDKTGTLTCNKMEFKGAAVGGKTYSEELLEDNSTFLSTVRVRRRTHFTDVLPPSAELVGCFQNALAQHDPNLERFLLGLAINHSCQRVRAKRSAVEDMDTPRGEKTGCCYPCLYLGRQKLGSFRSATTIEKMQESKTGLDCEEGPILYQGTSPDESALVGAAADFGFQFIDRTPLSIELEHPSGGTKEFKVLHVVEFTSERRMMSTVVTDTGPDIPDKIVSVFTKGADSSVVARCVVNADAVLDRTLEHTERMVKSFAEKGYRRLTPICCLGAWMVLVAGTLCVAYRELRFSEWEVIAKELHEAQVGDMAFREEKVAKICDERIETELTLLGCTAVEDKLQDEVPETVEALRNAGITVAMITGDKRETAINIARSCNLISNPDNMYRVLCSPPDGSDGGSCVSLATMRVSESSIPDARSAREEGVQFVEERVVWGLVDEEEQTEKDPSLSVVPGAFPEQEARPRRLVRGMSLTVESKPVPQPGASGQKYSVVVDGATLPAILQSPPSAARLRSVISDKHCESAVFCRVNPKQKGDIVRLVKDELYGRGRVLAIGDGANDINMIHQAHVGVGIFGQEGYQAAGTADYAISRFGDLYRLMFFHGRWNYERTTHYINFFIYKNFLFTLCQFYFGTASRWSGQTVYDSFYVLVYNSAFSLLPLTVAALFDRDIHPDLDGPNGDGRIRHPPSVTTASWRYQIIPKLYHRSAANYNFNPRVLFYWIVIGTFQSVVCYFGVWAFRQYSNASVGSHGLSSDLWMDSILLYTVVLALVSVLILQYTREWSWVLILAMVFFQFLLYIAFTFGYNSVMEDDDASGYLLSALGSVGFWLILLLLVVVCFLPAFALHKLKLLSSQVPLVDTILQLRRRHSN